jgi:hypothetical protein
MPIADDLTFVQGYLKDAELGADGTLWSRAELLTYYNDGYRDLVAQAAATRRWTILEVPPRFTATGTQRFEERFAQGGTFWVWPCGDASRSGVTASSLFELEVVEGYSGTAAGSGLSQPWERSHLDAAYQPFRFAVPRAGHQRIAKIWFNERALVPVAVRELDWQMTNWISLAGLPLAWTLGTGGGDTFEVYEVTSTDSDGYATVQDPYAPMAWVGMVRYVSGDRTYEVVTDPNASGNAYGVIRSIDSDDRQYWPVVEWPDQVPLGKIDRLQSSVDALLVLEVIEPDAGELTEQDTPGMLPQQLHKYLRYYTLARAFQRQGPGAQPLLAAFWLALFQRGVAVMRRLGFLARRDASYARQPETGRSRPQRPRLPSTYPRVGR